MTVLRLHMMPSPFLRHKAVAVKKSYLRDSPYLKTLTANMVETMKRANGIGLAAPQVGVALKVAVIQLPEWKEPVVLINPEMDEVEGTRAIQESCLSVPKFRNLVHRSERVKVKALGLDGKQVVIHAALH